MDIDDLNRISQSIIGDIKREFTRFIQDYEQKKYVRLCEAILDEGKHLLIVGHQDLIGFSPDLANTIFEDYYRY